MDALSHLIHRLPLKTDLFFVGHLCQIGHFNETNKGYLHFIHQGECLLHQTYASTIHVDKPCIIFSPSKVLHHIEPIGTTPLQVFCISFQFGDGVLNPLSHSLHNLVILSLSDTPHLMAVCQQIFEEYAQQRCGHQSALHHLCAYFIILVIRHCLAENLLKTSILTGLLDKHLSHALLAIHEHPEYAWNVEQLAKRAMMSRSAFTEHFKKVLGISPARYLTHWRLSLAQQLLIQGLPLSLVAERIGYSHTAVLTRIFVRELGITPSQWLKHRDTP